MNQADRELIEDVRCFPWQTEKQRLTIENAADRLSAVLEENARLRDVLETIRLEENEEPVSGRLARAALTPTQAQGE